MVNVAEHSSRRLWYQVVNVTEYSSKRTGYQVVNVTEDSSGIRWGTKWLM